MTAILLSQYRRERDGRLLGVFKCPRCDSRFESRMDKLKRMSGFCSPCSSIHTGEKNTVHGHSMNSSRIYVTWANMKRRCINPRGKEKRIYKNIELFAGWYDFVSFLNWSMQNGYTDEVTIDRINPSLGYCPENCRFADYSTQSANRKITGKNKSGYIGISFEKGSWVAKVQWRKIKYYLGRFNDPKEAAIVRDSYVIKHGLPHTLNV